MAHPYPNPPLLTPDKGVNPFDAIRREVAAAQAYFAVQAREAEMAAASAPTLPEDYEEALVALLAKVRESKMLAQKAGKWDEFLDARGLCGMTELADLLRTNVRTLTGWLVEIGIFRRQTSRNGTARNMPRKAYQDSGEFVVKRETKNGWSFQVAYATARGIDLVVDIWEKRTAA